MPTFVTPQPIFVTLDVGMGDIQVVASDRTDTVVDVRPSDPAKKSDVTAAEQTRVEYSSGRLLVKTLKGWKWSFRAGKESIDVRIELPTGSQVSGETGVAALRCTGRIGGCQYKTGVGDIQVDEAGSLDLRAGAGDITVGHAVGNVEASTGTGAVGIGSIDGSAVVKNSNGDTWIGEVTDDVRVKAANGRITIDRARAGGDREDRQRRRAPRRGRAWRRPRRDRGRHDRDRRSRWRGRLAGSRYASSAACGTSCEPSDRPGPDEEAVDVHARTSLRRHHDPPLPTRTTSEGMNHDHHDLSIRDRGHRAAEVLRRQRRARRHRPGRRRGNDLRPARPQRRREDHRRADPVHA